MPAKKSKKKSSKPTKNEIICKIISGIGGENYDIDEFNEVYVSIGGNENAPKEVINELAELIKKEYKNDISKVAAVLYLRESADYNYTLSLLLLQAQINALKKISKKEHHKP